MSKAMSAAAVCACDNEGVRTHEWIVCGAKWDLAKPCGCIWLIWGNNRFSPAMKLNKTKWHWLFWSSQRESPSADTSALLCRWCLKHCGCLAHLFCFIREKIKVEFQRRRKAPRKMPCSLPHAVGVKAETQRGSQGTGTCSSWSSCVLIIPRVPKAEGPSVRCPISGSGPGKQETGFSRLLRKRDSPSDPIWQLRCPCGGLSPEHHG